MRNLPPDVPHARGWRIDWGQSRTSDGTPIWFGRCPNCEANIARYYPTGLPSASDGPRTYQIVLAPGWKRVEGVWRRMETRARRYGLRGRAYRHEPPQARSAVAPDGQPRERMIQHFLPTPQDGLPYRMEPIGEAGQMLVCPGAHCGVSLQLWDPSA